MRPDIEQAKNRIVNLVSLYLESTSGGDLRHAAESLRDHSFFVALQGRLGHARAMLALPESTSFHTRLDSDAVDERGVVKGLDEWSLRSFADYQELARRQPFQQEMEAALWLAAELGMDAEELEEAHTHAEAVIRSALLAMATRRTEFPDWVEFENGHCAA